MNAGTSNPSNAVIPSGAEGSAVDETSPTLRQKRANGWGTRRENGVVEIESEWTARDRELKILGGPARTFLCPG